jgi:hypothetical protein
MELFFFYQSRVTALQILFWVRSEKNYVVNRTLIFCSVENLSGKLYFDNEIVQKGNEENMKVKNLRITILPKRSKIHLHHLFPGNPILGNIVKIFLVLKLNPFYINIGPFMERFVLQYSDAVFNELRAPIEAAFSEVFFQISNRVFDPVPYNTIFLE